MDLAGGKKSPIPQVVGKYTDNLVYRRIAPALLKELRKRNPSRRERHHQWFNETLGLPKLRQHISAMVLVMRACSDWADFMQRIDKAWPLQWQEGSLFFNPEADANFELKFNDF